MLAKQNLVRYTINSAVWCICTDLFSGLNVEVDLVVSNPPYVAENEWETLMPEVRMFEPRSALVAGDDGLAIIRKLILQSLYVLKPGGVLLMEIAPHQRNTISKLAQESFEYLEPVFYNDLAGKCRVVELRKKG
jgi:release factor glutamine methyltransferase